MTPTPRGKHIHAFLAGRVAGPAVPPGLSAHGVERVHVEVQQHGDEPSQEARRPSPIESSGCGVPPRSADRELRHGQRSAAVWSTTPRALGAGTGDAARVDRTGDRAPARSAC